LFRKDPTWRSREVFCAITCNEGPEQFPYDVSTFTDEGATLLQNGEGTVNYALLRRRSHSTRLPNISVVKGKAIPLQAWKGPEGSRRVRLPD
jgi:hypothetical protein